MDNPKPTVLVTGDIVVDHHIYEGNRHHFGDMVNQGVFMIRQCGGAAILAEQLDELSNAKDLWDTIPDGKVLKDFTETPEAKCVQNAFAFWRPFPKKKPREKQFWRVSEAMGFGAEGSDASSKDRSCLAWPSIEKRPGAPEVIAISEGGMGFRETKKCWEGLNFSEARHIILKTSAPIGTGGLWETLTSEHRDRLTVIISANELRKTAARIGTGLSWDATFEDLLRELS
ncbi:MAG: hypothetical protein KDL87_19055, partial [Verrucomicrobiae bacterium]|nr:hypothetical protein [Verrucomicrobiae bacterium]